MPIRPTRRIADAVVILLIVQIALFVAQGLALLYRIRLLERVQAGGRITLAEADRADTAVITSTSIWLLVLVATGIVWCVWQHRAQANAIELAGGGLQFTPGWAVGWWFIPFANLVKPFQAIRELWKASYGGHAWRSLPTWRVIGWWWALYLGANVIDRGISRSGEATSISELIGQDTWSLAALGTHAVAAILAIVIVRSIVRMQADAIAASIPAMPSFPGVSIARVAVLEMPPPPPAG